ncbi:alpha/beta hydrolase family protein [Fretibacter rubidus]|uniref:alpha/beta hydrolase family protein n=1 Tax=Fretibacter rubidus TaxID=570162 RepID=UPI00352AF15F
MKTVFRAIFILIVWIIAAPIVAAQTLPDVDDLLGRAGYGSFDLSPTGDFLVIADQRKKNTHKLLIMDMNNRANVKALGVGDGRLNWARWATDDRLIVSLTITQMVKLPSSGGPPRLIPGRIYTRLLSMNKDGCDVVGLFKDADADIRESRNLATLTSILPGDPDHVLIPVDTGVSTLYRVNINDGSATPVEEGKENTFAWSVDSQGRPIARYDYTMGGTYVAVYGRLDNGKWRHMGSVKTRDLNTFRVIAGTDQPGVLLVSATPDGTDKAGVYRYNMKRKSYDAALSVNAKVDLYGTLLDNAGRYIAATYFDDRLRYDFVDPAMDVHFSAVDKHFGGRYTVRIESISESGKRWLLHVQSPQEPGAYYDYELITGRVEFITDTHPRLDRKALGKSEAVSYAARDGLSIHGYLHNPPTGFGANPPLVVLPHGGPEARDYFDYDPIVAFLTSRGYRVFQPNFRGSSGYGKAFVEAGYREWGAAMQDDITDGVEHLIKAGKATRGNICIIGASYGGYAALMGAIRTPQLFNCAASINGVTDLIDIMDYDAEKFGKKSYAYKDILKKLGKPTSNKKELQARSPLYRAEEIKIPLLLIHGERDSVVPIDQSDDLATAMKAAGGDVTYVKMPSLTHNLLLTFYHKDLTRDQYYAGYEALFETLDTFLSEHLRR